MTTAEIKQLIRDKARQFNLDESIALAQAQAESSFRPTVIAKDGGCGLWQFMPATAKRFGLKNCQDPVESSDAWGRYMTFLMNKFNRRYDLALAGYNWGENRAQLATALRTGKPLTGQPTITRNYVNRILQQAGRSIPDASGEVGQPQSNGLPVETRNALLFGLATLLLLAALSGKK